MKKVLSVLCMALLAGGMIFTSCTKTYTITTATNVDAWGTVTGGGSYAEGAVVELKAIPAVGYEFVKWNEDNSTVNPRTITVTGDAIYTAHFRKSSPKATVTFNNETWTAGKNTGLYWASEHTWDVYSEKVSGDYPIADVCIATTEATVMYNRCDDHGELTSSNFKWIEYYEDSYLYSEDDPDIHQGDWWAKNVTLQIYDFDATTLKVNAFIDATMFDAAKAFVPAQGAVGVEAAPTTTMKDDLVNIQLATATAKDKLRKKSHTGNFAIGR